MSITTIIRIFARRRYHLWAVPLFYGLLLAGCSAQTVSPSPTPSHTSSQSQVSTPYAPPNKPVTSAGCTRTFSIATGISVNMTIPADPADSNGSSTRMYRVHIPTAYQSTQRLPVILAFHGHGGNATSEESSTGFSQFADQQHFIAVYPQGLPDSNDGGIPFWASAGPIDYGIDESHFVSNMLDDLQQRFCIDPQRIYATGMSNGGGMTNYLACRLAGRIAAFAPVAGNYYALPGGCHPNRPVPILEVHGTADTVVPYNGIPASESPSWPLPSVPQWLQEWATRDGCSTGPTIFLRIPQSVTAEQWTNCQGGVTVIHYRMENGGHSWPQTLGTHPITEVMWQFFQQYPLPPPGI